MIQEPSLLAHAVGSIRSRLVTRVVLAFSLVLLASTPFAIGQRLLRFSSSSNDKELWMQTATLPRYNASDTFQRDVTIDALLVWIDASLCLSSPQERCFTTLLTQQWQPDWVNAVREPVNRNSKFRSIIDALPTAELNQFLRPSQRTALLTPIVDGSLLAGNSMVGQGFTPEKVIRIQRERLERAAQLKIEEAQTLCHLRTSQIDQLTNQAGIAIESILAEQRAALFDQTQTPSQINELGLDFLAVPAAAQLATLKIWQYALRDAFDESSFEKYTSRESSRATLRRQARAGVLALQLGSANGLSTDQQRELATGIHANVASDQVRHADVVTALKKTSTRELRTFSSDADRQRLERAIADYAQVESDDANRTWTTPISRTR